MEKSNEVERKREQKAEFDASEIEYVSYGGEHHLPLIMGLVDQELSEPYSIFTYRYFVYLWPQLSFLVFLFIHVNCQDFSFFLVLISMIIQFLFVLGISQRKMRRDCSLQDGGASEYNV